MQTIAKKQLEEYGNVKKGAGPVIKGGKYSQIHQLKNRTDAMPEEYNYASPKSGYAGVTQSVKNLKQVVGNYDDGKKYQIPNGYGSQKNLGYQIYDRAQQVENDSRRKEHETMTNVMNIHGNHVRKGLNVLNK
jgi:hypothetical protein